MTCLMWRHEQTCQANQLAGIVYNQVPSHMQMIAMKAHFKTYTPCKKSPLRATQPMEHRELQLFLWPQLSSLKRCRH